MHLPETHIKDLVDLIADESDLGKLGALVKELDQLLLRRQETLRKNLRTILHPERTGPGSAR